MKQRSLGRTGLVVSEIGLGCWQLASSAWGTQSNTDAERIVHTALDAGCTFFDTAPGYGEGRSESLLGQALKGRRSQAVLSSKFGHPAVGPADFSVAALRPSVEASLRRLQTDHLDLLLVHNPPPDQLDGTQTELYVALRGLQQAGWIRSYGVSVDTAAEVNTVLSTTDCAVLEVLFNAFHQGVSAVFERTQAAGVGLIAKVPLDSGWLAGRYGAHRRFDGVRGRWSAADVARRAALVDRFRAALPEGQSVAHAALGYVLAQPAIATAIPGAKTPQQVLDNLAAAQTPMEAGTVRQIRALWEHDIAPDPLPW